LLYARRVLTLRIPPDEALERARRVHLLLLDCDGVMTDGGIYVTPDGDEIKRFDVQDGHGIVLWRRAGRTVGVLTGRGSRALEQRVAQLKIEHLVQRSLDKLASFEELLAGAGVAPDAVAYMGDDVVDVPLMRRVAFAVAPPNAVPEALEASHAVTEREGGRGAVRETIDHLLRAQGLWDGLMARYMV
jgi:3-deoxy-D-manno-octulosonate 8-phosphate phosphatase (KDO 8-P phosphatase)